MKNDNEADLIRCVIAGRIYGHEGTGVTIEEIESVLAEVPDSLLLRLDPDSHEQLVFLRDFADRSVMFWRLLAGDINHPMAASGALQ